VAGKRGNRGFEGLAVSPDGKSVYAALQSAMLDEGGAGGTISRIVQFDTATGLAVRQFAYRMEGASQGRGLSALMALNDHEFLVLERNNRGVGVGAEINPPNKRVYRIDISGATDITGTDVDAPGAAFNTVSKSWTPFLDLSVDTLAALGNKTPESWEGLVIGPRLMNGGFMVLAGTDNDYSVTQNGSGAQFDVYFNLSSSDAFASSIQCPLGQSTGCFLTSNGQPVALALGYSLQSGVLHAYRFDEPDLAGYVAPAAVPEPASWTAVLGSVALLWAVRRQHRASR
jgi:hypothetical protein